MSNPFRLLAVSHCSGLNGAERSFLQLMELLPNYDVTPVVLTPTEGPLVECLRAAKIDVRITGHTHWCRPRKTAFWTLSHMRQVSDQIQRNYRAVKRAIQHVNEDRFDLVYTNTTVSPLGGAIAWRKGLPNVWHAREFVESGLGWRFDFGKRVSFGGIRWTATRIVCNSDAVRKYLLHYFPASRLQVVYNGPLDMRWRNVFSARESVHTPVRVCLVGSIDPYKRVEDAIAAVSELKHSGLPTVLHIFGDGAPDYQRQLVDVAESLGVAGDVVWEGFVDDTPRAFLDNDIALVCSRCEAFGRVVVEAMAAGCPVIGSDAGGIPEIIEHEQTGLLYNSGDVTSLVSCVRRLVADNKLYRRISVAGRDVALGRFTVDRYVGEMVSVFLACAQGVAHRKCD